jgi:DNA-binding NtrC family response regulator
MGAGTGRSRSENDRETRSGDPPLAMVGHSPVFVAMLDRIAKVARYRESVLTTGESGSGARRGW